MAKVDSVGDVVRGSARAVASSAVPGAGSSALLTRVAALRWPLLVIMTVLLLGGSAMMLGGEPSDWGYFHTGSRQLLDAHPICRLCALPGGLHLYANYPMTTAGPMALLPARAFNGTVGLWLVVALMSALGLVFVRCVEQLTGLRTERARLTLLVGGALTVLTWRAISVDYGHLDDALVLAFIGLAACALRRENPVLTGILLGLAVASKPTALVALPMLLAFRGRPAVKAALAAGATSVAAWGPFVLADPRTWSAAGSYIISVHNHSPLLLLGLHAGDASPGWVRPVQLVAALALGCVAARRGRWEVVPLIGFTVRYLLDPGGFSYYASSVVAAAFLVDAVRHPGRMPVLTLVSSLTLFYLPGWVGAGVVETAAVQAAGCLALLVMLARTHVAARAAVPLPA